MDQNNKAPSTEQMTFADIIKMFRGKLKVFICVALIAALIGAGVGVLITQLDKTYGGEITFYLVPGESTQVLLPILKSESFAEKLLLDENGLPPRAECDPADYDAALAAVEAKNAAKAEKHRIYKERTSYPYTFAKIEEQYNNLLDEYNRINTQLKTYLSAQDEIASQPDHSAKIAELEGKLAVAETAWKQYKTETYDPAVEVQLALDEEYYVAGQELYSARRNAEKCVEKVVSVWREDEEIKNLVTLIQQSVTYNYVKIIESEKNESTENQNNSFLVITVAVEKDEETAAKIVDMIKDRTPGFVTDEVERLTGTVDARCTLTSTFTESKELGDNSLIKNVILYAAIAVVIGIFLVCATVIVKNLLPDDMSNKKSKKTKKATENVQ